MWNPWYTYQLHPCNHLELAGVNGLGHPENPDLGSCWFCSRPVEKIVELDLAKIEPTDFQFHLAGYTEDFQLAFSRRFGAYLLNGRKS